MPEDDDFLDGDTVEEGSATVDWAIRAYHEDGAVRYDWIVDAVNGNYTESDWTFGSIEEAKADLGVLGV